MSNTGGAIGIKSESDDVADLTVHGIAKDISKPSSLEPSVTMEKGELREVQEDEEDEIEALSHEHPFPALPGEELETQQFTVRAVLVGCILGAVISASNIYLGLKTGW